MSIAEIRDLPTEKKLELLEAIWDEFRSHPEALPWHKQLLDQRRRDVEEGHEELLDWDDIKDSLGWESE